MNPPTRMLSIKSDEPSLLMRGEIVMAGRTLMLRAEPEYRLVNLNQLLRALFIGHRVHLMVIDCPRGLPPQYVSQEAHTP